MSKRIGEHVDELTAPTTKPQKDMTDARCTEKEISQAFGIPPEMVHRERTTYERYREYISIGWKMALRVLTAVLLCAGVASAVDGYVHVRSVPPGAVIYRVVRNDVIDTGMKTPATVKLSAGRHEIVLHLDGYINERVNVKIDSGVLKPGPITMTPITNAVTIVAEPWTGARVVVDGRPALDESGDLATVPCVLRLAPGRRTIALVKDGCVDRLIRRAVEKDCELVVRAPPVRGRSVLASRLRRVEHVGRWVKADTGSVFTFRPDGIVSWKARPPYHDGAGRWALKGGRVWLSVPGIGTFALKRDGRKLVGPGNWKFARP